LARTHTAIAYRRHCSKVVPMNLNYKIDYTICKHMQTGIAFSISHHISHITAGQVI
jgi:hypothetical protein